MEFYTFLSRLLNMSLTSGVAIVWVMVLRLFLRRAPKGISYALWGIVLFRLLCPVSVQSDFSLYVQAPSEQRSQITSSLEYIPQEIAHDVQLPSAQQNQVAGPLEDVSQEELHAETSEVLLSVPGRSDAIALPDRGEQQVLAERSIILGSLLWMTGVGAMTIYAIWSYLDIWMRLRTASRLRGNIWLADEISSPFVLGLLRPKIYLPSNLQEQEQGYILLHEQHHIRRLDHIFKALGFLALTLHWFNPLVWVAYLLASQDMEMSCDEAVVKKLGEDIRADYTASLLSFATGRRVAVGMPLAFGEGDTGGRIRNLARWKRPGIWVTLAAMAACAALAVGLLTNPAQEPAPAYPGSYDVEEITYLTPSIQREHFPMLENSAYAIDGELTLSSTARYGFEGAAFTIGTLTELELGRENFDELFSRTGGEGWLGGANAASIRRSNAKAWMLVSGKSNLYYLLQQKNGDVYLAYGFYDHSEKDDPGSDDTSLHFLLKLKPASNALVPGVCYVSYDCLYMSPLSSFLPMGGDSGYQYVIRDDAFDMVNRAVPLMHGEGLRYESSTTSIPVDQWAWRELPYTAEEWNSWFLPKDFYPSTPAYPEGALYQYLTEDDFLLLVGQDLWLVKKYPDTKMGTHLGYIYRLVPEDLMGAAQWDFLPQQSNRPGAFPITFDLPEVSAFCYGGLLSNGSESGRHITLAPGEVLHWMPIDEDGVTAAEARITFQSSDGRAGTIYITPEEGPYGAWPSYRFTLVGTGLHLDQNSDGAVVSQRNSS